MCRRSVNQVQCAGGHCIVDAVDTERTVLTGVRKLIQDAGWNISVCCSENVLAFQRQVSASNCLSSEFALWEVFLVYYNTRGVQGADCSLNNKDLRLYFLYLLRTIVDPPPTCSLLGSLFSEEFVVISDNFTIDKRFGLVDRAETYGNTAGTKGNPRECPFPQSTRFCHRKGLKPGTHYPHITWTYIKLTF